MSLRLPAELAEELETVAAVDGQSLAELIRRSIAEHIAERKRSAEFQQQLRGRIQRTRQLLPRPQHHKRRST
jgi:hypothetical protein